MNCVLNTVLFTAKVAQIGLSIETRINQVIFQAAIHQKLDINNVLTVCF